MCGIVGFVNKEKNKQEIIEKMAERIKHRGPDDAGYYVDKNVALGHRRLSIIDLSRGHQPIYNENEDVVVIFNGEIYNYMDLTKELKKKKHHFKTTTDTEVLVHGYEEWGSELPKKLRGMFAFAIWDKKHKTLFCARDNFGIKPFYYGKFNDTFMFASEIKAFLDNPDFKKEINLDALPLYLSFSFNPLDETFFKGVYKLPAGSYLIYKDNQITIEKYYDVKFDVKEDTLDNVVNKIDEIMQDSVEHHQISDVEVGSFLSSGVDSSYIVSLAKPNKTYTVGYNDLEYSEISYAKDLSNKLGIENKSKIISKEEYLEVVPKLIYHMDEPFSDPSAISLYFLSKEASKDVKVCLSGEGADEFFGGYNTYLENIDLSWYNKIPYFIRHGIAKLLELTPEFRGRNFLVRRGYKLEDDYVGISKIFSEKERNKILKEKSKILNKDIKKEIFNKNKDENNLNKMQAIDINFWLVNDILHKGDCMSMANSLEVRVPFVDKEVFNMAKTLEMKHKIAKNKTKLAMREASKKVIPTEAYNKRKLGFPVPLRSWICESPFYDEVRDVFASDYASLFFKQDKIIKMLDNCTSNKKFQYKKVWTIYAFLKWYEIFFVNEEV